METIIIFFSFFQHCTHKVLTNHREKKKRKGVSASRWRERKKRKKKEKTSAGCAKRPPICSRCWKSEFAIDRRRDEGGRVGVELNREDACTHTHTLARTHTRTHSVERNPKAGKKKKEGKKKFTSFFLKKKKSIRNNIICRTVQQHLQ